MRGAFGAIDFLQIEPICLCSFWNSKLGPRFGSIFFPNTAQIQITVRRGIQTTKAGLEKLKQDTQHSCAFCESIEQLRTSRKHRIAHNLAAWLDTLER